MVGVVECCWEQLDETDVSGDVCVLRTTLLTTKRGRELRGGCDESFKEMGVEVVVVVWRKERREDGFVDECEAGEQIRGEDKMALIEEEEEEAMANCFFSQCVCERVTEERSCVAWSYNGI